MELGAPNSIVFWPQNHLFAIKSWMEVTIVYVHNYKVFFGQFQTDNSVFLLSTPQIFRD